MKVLIAIALFLAAVIPLDGENNVVSGDDKKSRKHYGLSYHNKCKDFVKTFTCMTSCKSIGFQVFRMDFKCKCYCHELKTTTILPFFKWRTNGTTKTWAKTHSPSLYHVVGTLSPATYPDYGDLEGNDTMANDTSTGNDTTSVAAGGENSTEAAGGDSTGEIDGAGGNGTDGTGAVATGGAADATTLAA
nr:uncharacterized protein LOC110371933 [Helicoverpa armigera]